MTGKRFGRAWSCSQRVPAFLGEQFSSNYGEAGAIRVIGSRLGGRARTTRYCIDLRWMERSSETAKGLRSFSRHPRNRRRENGEPEERERANGTPRNSERCSPDQKEQENEKNAQPIAPRGAQQVSQYEQQRLRQRIRKEARTRGMPSPLSTEELQARRMLLRDQAELLKKSG